MQATRPGFPPLAPRAEWKSSQKFNAVERLESVRFENQTLHAANRHLQRDNHRYKRNFWIVSILLTLAVVALSGLLTGVLR